MKGTPDSEANMLTNDLHTDAAAGQVACGERGSSPQSCGYRGNDRHSSGIVGGFIVVYIHTFACFLCRALLLLFFFFTCISQENHVR